MRGTCRSRTLQSVEAALEFTQMVDRCLGRFCAPVEFRPAPDGDAKAPNVGERVHHANIEIAEFRPGRARQIYNIPLTWAKAGGLEVHPGRCRAGDKNITQVRVTVERLPTDINLIKLGEKMVVETGK